jgi:transcriptional regulator with XRE-family HTH domain
VPARDLPDWITAERRDIGARIRQLRRQAQLTQDEVVRRSGVDRRTLQRIEAGTTDTRLSRLQGIAQAIGVPLADLMPAPPRV